MKVQICHSCGMPLDEKSVSKYEDIYCIYCQNQETGILKSFEEVRNGSIKASMEFMGLSQEEAEKMADEMMPKLPRWKE